jgi:hypothetical protein
MGDHFICNGLVHALAEKYGELYLICKIPYLKTVTHLYEDYENIKIIYVEDEFQEVAEYSNTLKMPILRIGFENCDTSAFEESFYTQLELDPECEYTNFKLPNRLEEYLYLSIRQKLGENYLFIHDTCSAKKIELSIDSNLPRHYANRSDTSDVLDYARVMIEAKEVHVINSGLNNLAFQLYLKKKLTGKLFYHDARKIEDGGIPIKVPAGIEVIKYG